MKVSVAMITYNHEAFIAEALDSVLAQDVDFDYELVVSDDCSKDGTAEIVGDYQRRFPELIKAELNAENLGANANAVATMARCRGEYVALLDGDDFWTSRDKLQAQVDHLDAHPDHAFVFHPVDVLDRNGGRRSWTPPGRRASYDLDALMRGNFIATSSVVCRNGEGLEFPEWYDEAKGMPGDWVLFCRLARGGRIGYIDRVMSVYRLHEGSIWSSGHEERVRRLKALIEISHRLNEDFGHEYAASTRHAVMVMRLKILVSRTAPFVVNPLISLRHRLSG